MGYRRTSSASPQASWRRFVIRKRLAARLHWRYRVRTKKSGARLHSPAESSLRIAAAQLAPVFLDRDATLGKVVRAIDEAAAQGAALVAFGETLVPGYPAWICKTDGARFNAADQKALHACYLDQAVTLEDGHLDLVVAAARRGRIAVILGIA